MNILIGCEESQTVCLEFRKLGHEAFSCDIQPCSGGHPEWHLQMDIFEAIKIINWDLIGLHPVCTKMAVSGNRTYAPGKPKHTERIESIEWTINLWQTACRKSKYIYMENPMGAMNTDLRLPKPQIIHPYFFGDEYQKKTCIWLQNLPKLYHNKDKNLFDQNITHTGKAKWLLLNQEKKCQNGMQTRPPQNQRPIERYVPKLFLE